MNGINQVIIEGNVVRQPEKRQGLNFIACSFPIAVNRSTKMPDGKTSEEVSFFDIDAFGITAENSCKLAVKGRGIRVIGRLKQSRWKDDAGKPHNKTKIIAEHIEYRAIPRKSESSQTSGKDKIDMLQEAAEAAMHEAEEDSMTF